MCKFKMPVVDWYDLHGGFELELNTGYTALVGPNGAGKTTLLRQIQRQAKELKIPTFKYSNFDDGGRIAIQNYGENGKTRLLATCLTSSEGEQMAINLGEIARKIGKKIRDISNDKTLKPKTLFLLLDSLDSGASIDRLRDIVNLFDLVVSDCEQNKIAIYIINAANSFEFVKGRDCVNPRTGEHLSFSDYGEYAEFVCGYLEKCTVR